MLGLLFATFLVLCCSALSLPLTEFDGTLKLRILHNNDMHGRFLETDELGNPCSAPASCYGGFARVAHLINFYRSQAREANSRPVIYLNAGDTFTGSIWFSIFKDAITSELMNQLQPNATTFGNHEFDFGEKILARYVKQSRFPFIVSNLDLTKSKFLSTASNLHESIIWDVNGVKVGIIGYVTPETMTQSSPGNILIRPEFEAVKTQTSILKANDIDIIIALSHSGLEVDKEIARNFPDIDIIVGGHTNSFLFNGPPPDRETPDDVYPLVIEEGHTNRKSKTLIVQAYAYTKYLGILDVDFDNKGNLINWTGNPILVNFTIPQDEAILNIIEKYRPNITALSVVIGSTKYFINGKRNDCRHGECTFGNLITDAMLNARHSDLIAANQSIDTFVALTTAGGIKGSLENFNITLLDIRIGFPYENLLYTVSVRGDVLLKALEHSAAMYNAKEDGGFLHLSGIKVVYNISNEIGSRVTAAIRTSINTEGEHKSFKKIDAEKTYKIVMGKFLFKGGDGYIWSTDEFNKIEAIKMNYYDSEALLKFIKLKSPLSFIPEGRITVVC